MREEQPAFPAMDMNSYQGIDRLELRHEGLSKREYATIKILAGLVSEYDFDAENFERKDYVSEAIQLSNEMFDQLDNEESKLKKITEFLEWNISSIKNSEFNVTAQLSLKIYQEILDKIKS